MKLRFVFLIALISSLILTPLFRKIAVILKIYDYPNGRKIHTKPTPLLGGVAVFISFLLVLSFSKIMGGPILGMVLGALVVATTGVIDDIREVSAGVRLFFQVIASLIVIKFGIVFTFLPNNIWGVMGELILTLLWIIGITNGMNYLDGLDGLAGGVTSICAFTFFIIARYTGQYLIQLISLALLGVTLGFLPYNIKKAKVFLGDCGSTFFGFMLASVAILGTWGEDNVIDLSIPILILGIPIFDMVFTTISRVRTGKIKSFVEWMAYTGKDHFHHRLLNLGLKPLFVLSFILLTNVILGISAFVLWKAASIDAFLLLIQAIMIFLMISVLMLVEKKNA